MALELTIDFLQAIDVTAAPKDRNGNPAQFVGPAAWSVVSGPSTLGTTLEGGAPLPADGLQQSLVSSAEPSDSVFRVSGQNSMGETIEEFVNLHVIAPPAVRIDLTAGAAYNKS